ncbi:OmpA family protein [Actimicrobium antarcticum]|uniref:OmpA-like domain-containing protein n=1 Tax=Actimicrobium antarcticum TaxID=1051899 RepID=A0ABP7TP90_9BURK
MLFGFGSSVMSASGAARLESLIAYVQENRLTTAKVIGDTDQIGSDAINQTLSQARADAVRRYLRSHGLANLAITTEGRGASHPVTDPARCAGLALAAQRDCLSANRRVMIEFPA